MLNKETWTATKFVKTKQGYSFSTDPTQVLIGSRLIASIQVSLYQDLIEKHASGLLLDLGCGNVPLYQMYKDYIIDNICVDWSSSFHENPYLDHEVNINDGIPLQGKIFDTILMTDVLEHISNPELVMSEVSRLLKPRGKLILTVPFLYKIHEKPYDYFRYTEFSLKMFCQKNKLDILHLEPYGGTFEIILDITAKQLARFSLISSAHLFLSRLVVNSRFGKKVSAKTSKNFPLGYGLVAQKQDNSDKQQ
ncbi:class I SAM-dependent methyltransferase [Acaryochloris sp. IP29b_bin.148]|uniref:methyltransferase domain-containing protein n=1 Tax=Acaryochloris sp. IP29b_bin.148 TaxID=2969218 RepID=UPI00262AD19E|nr:class I SAM-dependent methyltransferase [Acaryochloris sp. IP29b_bin.148]